MSKFEDFKQKQVYITGPRSQKNSDNTELFYRVVSNLRNKGFTIIKNPAHVLEFYGNDYDFLFYLKKYYQCILESDAVYVFGDYKNSTVVQKEIEFAVSIGLPIFYEEFND